MTIPDKYETFINSAIELDDGVLNESTPRSYVWIISQLECYCDIEGIDSFIARHGQRGIELAQIAHTDIGSNLIASCLQALSQSPDNEELRGRCNELVTDRTGYSFDSIYKYVSRDA